MTPAARRGRGGTTSLRVLALLAALALLVFATGFAVLWGRSDDGLIARARMGLPVDRAALSRTLSKTIRTTFVEFGISPGSQIINVDETPDLSVPRVLWTAYLPGRASTLQLNARLTESLEKRHAEILDAWEDTLAAPASEVHMRVGAGRVVTHELVLSRRVDLRTVTGLEPARILLVVDAFGPVENDSLSAQFLALGITFTGAVLPQYKGTRDWANLLARKENEVLAQLPMEPMNYPQRDPGPGAILVDMPSGQIQRTVKKHLSDIPHASGATSYMGAMALADGGAMSAVMQELKRSEKFYLDARTVPSSVAGERAAQEGVLCFRIDTMLEAPGKYDAQVKAMNRLLDDAVDLARRRGYAIVLAHPDRAALDVLKRAVPKLKRSGVRFEPLSSLLTPQAY